MIVHPVTIQLPITLYDKLKARAEQDNVTLEQELLQVVAAVVPQSDDLDLELRDTLAQLTTLENDALWRAAQSHLSAEISAELEALHWKRQREGLSAVEDEKRQEYVRQYEHSMLIRAQAAALLQQRGFDVSVLPRAQ
ncbi:MAG: hypothetical protein HY741_27360 [Chloroflexi bacterium]|nr:hypothetical protein [Chloroflexota bacterium]